MCSEIMGLAEDDEHREPVRCPVCRTDIEETVRFWVLQRVCDVTDGGGRSKYFGANKPVRPR